MSLLVTKLLAKFKLEQFGVLWGYFRQSGWRRSMLTHQSVDGQGNPMPWYSYAFKHFLESRLEILKSDGLLDKTRVFEFGSGNSTLWWSNYVGEIVSVEDNDEWYSHVEKNRPGNVTYHLAHDEESYLGTLADADQKFDIIIIDGSHREKSIIVAQERLSENGVLIIDNSDWEVLASSIRQLINNGFKQLEFYSIGPVNGHPWGTSVFYQSTNILGI